MDYKNIIHSYVNDLDIPFAKQWCEELGLIEADNNQIEEDLSDEGIENFEAIIFNFYVGRAYIIQRHSSIKFIFPEGLIKDIHIVENHNNIAGYWFMLNFNQCDFTKCLDGDNQFFIHMTNVNSYSCQQGLKTILTMKSNEKTLQFLEHIKSLIANDN